jgi:ABC-2 type transport system permease protein
MSPRRVAAVARRIVAQFRHDRRSVALLIVAPLVVLSLVGALWGGTQNVTPEVAVATDRTPAAIADRLVASTAIRGEKLPFDEALARIREGKLDAIVWVERTTLHIETEGSDPIRNGSTVGAVQRALTEALGSLGPAAPKIELSQLYGGTDYTLLDYLAPVFVAFFAFFFIFLLSAVAFLRERTSGTLERLLASPLRRGELVLGYLVGFSIFALTQAVVIIAFTVFVLKVQYRGNLATIFLVEAVMVVGAVSLGLLVSAAARNELQAVQFVPLVLLPQVFLSGFLVSVEQLPSLLRPISYVLPLTYANEALRAVMIRGFPLGDPLVLRDIGVLVLFALVLAIGAVASIRREVA